MGRVGEGFFCLFLRATPASTNHKSSQKILLMFLSCYDWKMKDFGKLQRSESNPSTMGSGYGFSGGLSSAHVCSLKHWSVDGCSKPLRQTIPLRSGHAAVERRSLSEGTRQSLRFLDFKIRESLTMSLGPSLQPV